MTALFPDCSDKLEKANRQQDITAAAHLFLKFHYNPFSHNVAAKFQKYPQRT